MMDEDPTSPRKKMKVEHSIQPTANNMTLSDPPNILPIKMPALSDSTVYYFNKAGKEAECGITEFVSPELLGFRGTMKTRYCNHIVYIHIYTLDLILLPRYTDFLVNEIFPSGEVVHLTNLKAPKPSTAQPEGRKIGLLSSTTLPAETERAFDDAIQQEAKDKQNRPEAKTDLLSATVLPLSATSGSFANHSVNQAPHQRLPPHMTASTDRQIPADSSPEKSGRLRLKVQLCHTSEGWQEFDEEKQPKSQEKENEDGLAKEKETEYMNETPGNKDKAVNEDISVYGPKASTQAQWQAFANAPERLELTARDTEVLLTYFTAEVVDAVLSLYSRVVNSPHRSVKDHGSVNSAVIHRQLRTKIHQDIRRIFNSRLETMTDSDGSMIIAAMPSKPTYSSKASGRPNENGDFRGNDHLKSRNQGPSQRQSFKGKPGWQDLGGEFLHFSLYKENKDTMEVISYLSKQMHLQARSFQFAGTKDRRAVTVQRVSVYRTYVDRMITTGRTLRNAKIGNYVYQPHALQLGELKGNEFVITLRECDFKFPGEIDSKTVVDGANSSVGEAISNLSKRGFINYYGLQRFGTFSTGTDIVGVKMLQGDFQGATDAILQYDPKSLASAQDFNTSSDRSLREDCARASAIHAFRNGAKTTTSLLLNLPRKFSAESAIIRHLSRANLSNDSLGALQMIPRSLRLMYVHAYQSLVWNMAASERWKRYGVAVVEGDLVLVDEHRGKTDALTNVEEVDQDGEAVVQPSADDRATREDDLFVRARALSKDEVESGRYNIYDVVLPTPGYDILYPSNDMTSFYQEFMASERGGGLDPQNMRRKWKDISLSGSYRKVLARPGEDIAYEVRTYDKDDEQFVETDADRLKKSASQYDPASNLEPAVQNEQSNMSNSTTHRKQEPELEITNETEDYSIDKASSTDTDPSGGVRLDWNEQPKFDKKIAVILRFQLGSSQYATMALRELMKIGGVRMYKPDLGIDH